MANSRHLLIRTTDKRVIQSCLQALRMSRILLHSRSCRIYTAVYRTSTSLPPGIMWSSTRQLVKMTRWLIEWEDLAAMEIECYPNRQPPCTRDVQLSTVCGQSLSTSIACRRGHGSIYDISRPDPTIIA